MINQNELQERLFIMVFAGVNAGIELEKIRSPDVIREKKLDIFTTADKRASEIIQAILLERYPNDSIDQEDAEIHIGTSGFITRIDPLDGTKQYAMSPMRVPIYCVSLALEYESETFVGVVYNPVERELYFAIKENGTFGIRLPYREAISEDESKEFLTMAQQLKVSEQETKRAQIFIELPSNKLQEDKQKEYWDQIIKINPIAYRLRAIGSGPLSICYVAGCNDVGAAIDFSGTTKEYDLLAAELIARESGSIVQRLPSPDPENLRYLIAKPAIYEKLKPIFNLV